MRGRFLLRLEVQRCPVCSAFVDFLIALCVFSAKLAVFVLGLDVADVNTKGFQLCGDRQPNVFMALLGSPELAVDGVREADLDESSDLFRRPLVRYLLFFDVGRLALLGDDL